MKSGVVHIEYLIGINQCRDVGNGAKLIVKELGISTVSRAPAVSLWLFAQPYSDSYISKDIRCRNDWTIRSLYGLSWNLGVVTYDQLETCLNMGTRCADEVFCKGA